MSQLIIPRRFYSQPQGAVEVDWNTTIASNITYCLPLDGNPYEIARGKARLTYGAGGRIGADNRGLSLIGNGSAACASIPLDLSASKKLTVSFWMYWDAFANDDDFAFELTSNTNTTDGGISVNPNDSSGYFGVYTRITSTGTGKYTKFVRPSAATWHHYTIGIDRGTANGVSGVWMYIDGVKQTGTDVYTAGPASTGFANSTLYLLSRNNTSLFGAGRIQNLIFRLNNAENIAEIKEEYTNPWQIFRAKPRVLYFDVGGATIPTLSSPGVTNILTTSATPQVTLTF